jgi:hypothetical protein
MFSFTTYLRTEINLFYVITEVVHIFTPVQYFTNYILQFFPFKNKDGSVCTYECQRTYSWLEVSAFCKASILNLLKKQKIEHFVACMYVNMTIILGSGFFSQYWIPVLDQASFNFKLPDTFFGMQTWRHRTCRSHNAV